MKPPSAFGIFLVALVFRIVHVWQLRRSPFFDVLLGDASGYDEWARRIAGGEWIGRDVFYQAPLYPYFLGTIYSIVGHNLMVVRVVQAVLGAASCALVGAAGRRFFSPGVGLAAGLAMAVYAPAIFFDGLLQKSVLDVLFVALALWLIARLVDEPHRRGVWVALGGCMGALALTRENALVFIVVILAWALLRTGADRAAGQEILKPEATAARKVRRKPEAATSAHVASTLPLSARLGWAASFVLGLAVILLPVAIRNYAVGGGFYLTTSQFGPNFYIGNNPQADGTYMSLRFGRGAPEFERQDATDLAQVALGRTLSPAEVSSYWTDKALTFVTTQPGAWLALMGRKFALLWNATEMLDTESQESYAEWSWPLRLVGWIGHFGVLVPLALAGAILAWPNRRRLGILYAMTFVYAASVVMFYVFARYRLPLVPLLMLFAGRAVVALVGSVGRGRSLDRPAAIFAATALILATIFTNWPMLSKTRMMAITETNLAVALQARGQPAQAQEHFQRAIALQPDYAPAHNNLGVSRRAAGDLAGAVDSYRQALAVNGDYPDAHYNLANALLAQNKPAEAAEHFKIALQSIPDSAGAINNLGIALTAEGKNEDAVAAFRGAVAADPNSAIAHRNLADALSSLGRTDEAIAEFRRALTLDPNDVDAHYNFGSVLLEAGRFDDAIAEFRAALQRRPQSAEAHNNLGIALGSKGDLTAAIEEFRRALTVRPDFAEAQRNLEMALNARPQTGSRR